MLRLTTFRLSCRAGGMLAGVAIGLLLAGGASAAPVLQPGADGHPTLEVHLDRATVVKMPANAATIVVGNPIIADVTTLKADRLVVVTGKGFGETNMIFLDNAGNAVQEATVRVSAATSQLTVQRGMDRESYSCAPRCEPTVSLGDGDAFMKGASSQISSRNSLAVPSVSH